jgi:hypothetical protein
VSHHHCNPPQASQPSPLHFFRPQIHERSVEIDLLLLLLLL